MSWQESFGTWRQRPYPSCPADVGKVGLVTLDADIAGLLLRCHRSGGTVDALTRFQLREAQQRLAGVVGRLSGECRDYFGELEDIVSAVL